LTDQTKNRAAKIPINNGKRIARTETPIDADVSVVETIGFPRPPVANEEAPLVIVVKLLTNPAAPPPAIIAKVHLIKGSISTIDDAITIVPATTEVGPAIVCNKLSTKGIKYAASSKNDAAIKTINAESVPIHSNPDDIDRNPPIDPRLIISNGTNIQNPTAAARLILSKILTNVSCSIIILKQLYEFAGSKNRLVGHIA